MEAACISTSSSPRIGTATFVYIAGLENRSDHFSGKVRRCPQAPAPLVNAAGIEPEPIAVVVLMASQYVKFWLPKKTPTVCTSAICSEWRTAVAVVTFVAQKLMVRLKAVAAPLQMAVAVVPS